VTGCWPSRVPGRFALACAVAIVAWLGCGSASAFARLTPAFAAAPSMQSAHTAGTSGRMTFIAASPTASTVPEVMIASADGTDPRPLGPAATAVLSPNGEFVAAVQPGSGSPPQGSSLVIYRVSKSKATDRVLRKSTGQLTILAWSPDSKWIAALDGDTLVVIPLHGRSRTIATGTINGASFAPSGSDRLVFAEASSLLVTAPVNLYTVALSGGKPVAITTDGLSQYPLWGPDGVVFAREASHASTTTELWLIKANGRDARQLTNVMVAAPFYGFEPVAFSANGRHLLANLVGNGVTEAWTIDLGTKPPTARQLGASGATTIGNAISRDGGTILLTESASSPSGDDFSGESVAVVPWSGGTTTTLVMHAAFASWDR
jgi:Tol biopolymer transport system component